MRSQSEMRSPDDGPSNLYVHFPFCRRKCRYCALYSRVGVSAAARDAYVRQLARVISAWGQTPDFRGQAPRFLGTGPAPSGGQTPVSRLKTIYFGGGSPALCDLRPILVELGPRLSDETEFTVELHPQDVSDDLLKMLRDGGVNRISMGVQSLDDATLAAMGRGYAVAEAARAFAHVKRLFDNAGIDLIVGYPGDPCAGWEALRDWGLSHCSVYSLQNERGLADVPDDDWVLDRIRAVSEYLGEIGLERYEISNYAVPGKECRHNLAVWRGEDYFGLGAGAYGRLGLRRTRNFGVCPPDSAGPVPKEGAGPVPKKRGVCPQRSGACPQAAEETVTPEQDALERRIFRLRTREGLDATGYPAWGQALEKFCKKGLLTKEGEIYRLTARGTEVCDSILAELV